MSEWRVDGHQRHGTTVKVDGQVCAVLPDPQILELIATIERFRAHRPADVTPPEMAENLVFLRRACDLLELEFAARAAEFTATDEYDRQGSTSAIHWIRHECHMSTQATLNAVDVGQQMPQLPQSTDAMLAGDIGFGHLALIASTAQALRDSPTSGGFDEAPLLQLAQEHSVSRFRHDCAHVRHAADARAYLADQVGMMEARSLELKARDDGALFLKGFFDPEGGATLRSALEPLARRISWEDDRARDRRLADALVELASHRLDAGDLPQRGGQRPHLQVTATLETLQGAAGAPAGELEFAAPIAGATVQRLACDAGVTRVLLGPDSAVVDVGRSKRLPSASTRRALAARDRGCVWPGCDRPASWTSAHHLQHWAQGGNTDLANLVLVCYRHHWKIHEGGWRLVRGEDQAVLAIPPTHGYLPRARAPDVPAA